MLLLEIFFDNFENMSPVFINLELTWEKSSCF